MKKRACGSSGQSLVELAVVLPLIVLLVLGVIEVSYALLDQHVVTKLTREGSNLISRNTSLQDATTAVKSMSTNPVNFDSRSTLIFSVIKKVSTTGSSNYNQIILYQRFQYGSISATSAVATAGGGSFGGPPDYIASNSDNDTSLRVTSLPSNLLATGGLMYITEVFTQHTLLTPLDRFGISIPNRLYSIAYF